MCIPKDVIGGHLIPIGLIHRIVPFVGLLHICIEIMGIGNLLKYLVRLLGFIVFESRFVEFGSFGIPHFIEIGIGPFYDHAFIGV